MIRMDSLKFLDSVIDKKIKGTISLDTVQENLEIALKECGFPISFTRDEIISGDLFNKNVENCIVIKNEEHQSDYFYYCVFVRAVGNLTTLHTRYGGDSKLTQAKNKEDEKKGSLLGAMGVYAVDQAKFDEEYIYYGEVDQAINELVR